MGKTKIILTEDALSTVEALKAALAENPEAAAVEIIDLVTFKNEQAQQLASLQAENKGHIEKIAALEADLSKVNDELVEVKAEAAVYEQTNSELSKQLAERADLQLFKDGKEKTTPKFEEKTFTLDDVVYGFNYPKTTINRVPVDVDHVVADVKLQQQLVEMKSGMIKVIEK